MSRLIDYQSLGVMMSKQALLLTDAIRAVTAVVDARQDSSKKIVRIAEILRKLDDDLEEVS